MRWIGPLVWLCLAVSVNMSATSAGEPVVLRMESLLVGPSHTPSAVVHVRNVGAAAYVGVVDIVAPEGWSLLPERQPVELEPGEAKRLIFTVKRGLATEANRYRLTARCEGGGVIVTHDQEIVTASAPYFKPTIDGDVAEWNDAIPARFLTAGKSTVISTYWNRRQFSILVAVEEDSLARGDAVQFSLAPKDARTGASPNDEVSRFEFLLTADGNSSRGTCYRLAEPGMRLSDTQTARELGPLDYTDASVAVVRVDSITYYECSIPFRPMQDAIRPSEGREFCLSVLVHDPDGSGVRDWGQAVGLWPSQRNRLAWSDWLGADWQGITPFDNKIPWGLCSSKY